MLGDSQLNVYVLDTNLTPRHRERLQAQLQTAMRSLPSWVFDLVRRRVESLGARNLPLIVEARPRDDPGGRYLGLGEIEGRPAARLMPKLTEAGVDWGHDLPTLLAKAVAHLVAPDDSDAAFWQRWREALEADGLREDASASDDAWASAGDRDLLLEMFAAYALKPEHSRWRSYPEVRAFLEEWRRSDES